MRFKSLFQAIQSRTLFLVLILLQLLYSGTQPQKSLANQDYGVRVTNKTQSFEVIGIKMTGRHVRLKLKNGYEKSIIDFKIALPRPLGKNGTVTDIVGDTNVIAPGATYEYNFTLPPDDAQQEREVVILTILFDDRTSDGDAETAANMVAERLGERIQVSRILPLLEKVLDLPDVDLQVGLETLKSQVAALSLSPVGESEAIEILSSKYASVFERRKDELIGQIGAGLYFGQGKFIVSIRDLEKQLPQNASSSLREKLNFVKKEYEKKLASL